MKVEFYFVVSDGVHQYTNNNGGKNYLLTTTGIEGYFSKEFGGVRRMWY